MKARIFADHAAGARLDPAALEAMKPWLSEEFGNPSQPYAEGLAARDALERARRTVARAVGAEEDEIFFTSGGTEGDVWAIRCAGDPDGLTVASAIEHHAVLAPLDALAREGKPVATVGTDPTGVVAPDALDRVIRGETRLVSVMLANNEIGTVEPVRALADAAHARGAFFHTDAVQAVGRIKVDVRALGVDLMTASAHKFGGPRGVGFLYVRKGTRISPLLPGGAQQGGLRAGTENVAGAVGTAAALRARLDRMDVERARLLRLEERIISRLDGLDFLRNGAEDRVPGILSLSFRGADGEAVMHRMDLCGIAISTGAACDSVRTQVSHVIRAIGVPPEYAEGTVRVSLGCDNTEEDADAIADALVRIIK